MTKTAAKTTETAAFPAFDAAEASDQFRAFAQKGVEQSKETYAKMKATAEDAQKTLEQTFETMKAAGGELSMKSISAMRANSEAGFAHLEALLGAKSFSEFVELQTSFLRKSAEMMVDQARELQTASTKAAEDVAKPIKVAFEKTAKELRAA